MVGQQMFRGRMPQRKKSIGNGSRQITDCPAKEINSRIYRVIQILPLCDQARVINFRRISDLLARQTPHGWVAIGPGEYQRQL